LIFAVPFFEPLKIIEAFWPDKRKFTFPKVLKKTKFDLLLHPITGIIPLSDLYSSILLGHSTQE
jgi:hypothetical protein